MEIISEDEARRRRLNQLVKIGLIRELFQARHLTRRQFEQLMQLQRLQGLTGRV